MASKALDQPRALRLASDAGAPVKRPSRSTRPLTEEQAQLALLERVQELQASVPVSGPLWRRLGHLAVELEHAAVGVC
jgi:hypothetical protein